MNFCLAKVDTAGTTLEYLPPLPLIAAILCSYSLLLPALPTCLTTEWQAFAFMDMVKEV
jgi:hypothetical protein